MKGVINESSNFTQPQYKNKTGLYAMDLTEWANTVKMEYINASKLSNEALAAMILDNNNQQTAQLFALGTQILDEIDAGTAEIIDTVRISTKEILKTVRSAEGHIVKVIQDNTGKIISVVREEGVRVRNTVREVGADIINDNREQHAVTNNLIVNNHKRTRNVVRFEAYEQRQLTKKTARETQQLEAMNIAISERLDALHFTVGLPVRIGDMQKQISKARIPHSKKMELLQRIRNQLSELYTSDRELDIIQRIIDDTINKYKGTVNYSDVPPMPEFLESVEPTKKYYPSHEKLENEEKSEYNKNEKITQPDTDNVKNYKLDECGFKTEEKVVKEVNEKLKK